MTDAPTTSSPAETCAHLADEHDVLGLLEYLRAQRVPLPRDLAGGELSRCIRGRAKDNLTGLSEDIFGAVLALGMTMLTRCQLHIEKELALADRFDDTAAPPVPGSLIDSQWIERAERIARFCADMTALRARVRHLNRLEDHARDESESPRRTPQLAEIDDDPEEAGSREATPAIRRKGVRAAAG